MVKVFVVINNTTQIEVPIDAYIPTLANHALRGLKNGVCPPPGFFDDASPSRRSQTIVSHLLHNGPQKIFYTASFVLHSHCCDLK